MAGRGTGRGDRSIATMALGLTVLFCSPKSACLETTSRAHTRLPMPSISTLGNFSTTSSTVKALSSLRSNQKTQQLLTMANLTRELWWHFEDGELIEGWVDFINGARFEGSCHGKSCPTIFKTFKRGKYQWKWGQCTYTGGSFAESFAGKVCCTARIFARARNMPARTCK